MPFPCTGCGLCCQQIHNIAELQEFHSGDGICIYYQKQKCSIYENRPIVCRVDDAYDQMFKARFTIDEYYKENAKICNQLQMNAVMDAIYKVRL
ncbi:YkgJ family cysteine cluster protein [Aliivibrio sp. S4TY2]|uniref:YkgJ family cysteine cluster protein n=1 Tax=unclassified Aliivibrio TaxID=2645654 RepID=UPI00237836BB|nr:MULTISPECIES: YkgJ family cysteine cluster protein [unclassified Aliivibrio]MDD9156390.1 YkgJ family cysteine cluster protein [Aliivibrio sp. S4TY2]MDD9162320.1 YkgJ family cysteine cluster protein [Aliivibrio sp. S4TY1]MDD9164098.1 YkgJ family cysteine cluster protein [Aliivibrio sp. S4MY2]MDD9167929.1 YkgJ family cysteine cluster protein [Aliivibrio sp. S4MY4]MDD9187406.1 YkgJ family cysteine cluster protein [Aliivibrio sp. S4MY3]